MGAMRTRRPKQLSTSPDRPLKQALWSFVGFGLDSRDPCLAASIAAGWHLELLLSDTGKALRLYIIEVGERSTIQRMRTERRPRVDAAEIEPVHGMHLCQRPPAVPRRCVTFRSCQRPARRGGATAELTAEPWRCPLAEPTAGPTAEPLAEPTPDAAAA